MCAACENAKAHRRSPGVSGKYTGPEQEMVLKEGDVAPGDCCSIDHYISPIWVEQ